MMGVVFIFVRDDASDVEALADAFELAGFSISGTDKSDHALSIVVWSRAAMRSAAFRAAADRALERGRVVVASLTAPPDRELIWGAPVVDISSWNGEEPAGLDALFDAVLQIARPHHANVIALPGPVYHDAEFTEVRPPVDRARAAWEAPIPSVGLRAVQDDAAEKPEAKYGAPSPRRDFRRVRSQPHNRAHAALAFAVVALIGGAGFALMAPATTRPTSHAVREAETGGVSLASASTDAIGLEDATPTEQARLFEPAQQIGHPGVEPPSARSVRAAAYTSRHARRDRSASGERALIPAAANPTSDLSSERSKTGPLS